MWGRLHGRVVVRAWLATLLLLSLAGCASHRAGGSAAQLPAPPSAARDATGAYRFDMTQHGRRMSADEFDAWMKARGIRVAKGAQRPGLGNSAQPPGLGNSAQRPGPGNGAPRTGSADAAQRTRSAKDTQRAASAHGAAGERARRRDGAVVASTKLAAASAVGAKAAQKPTNPAGAGVAGGAAPRSKPASLTAPAAVTAKTQPKPGVVTAKPARAVSVQDAPPPAKPGRRGEG